jgi:hypothetical protein
MSEFVENSSRFPTTNITNDSIYCDCGGRMFTFLKRSSMVGVSNYPNDSFLYFEYTATVARVTPEN